MFGPQHPPFQHHCLPDEKGDRCRRHTNFMGGSGPEDFTRIIDDAWCLPDIVSPKPTPLPLSITVLIVDSTVRPFPEIRDAYE